MPGVAAGSRHFPPLRPYEQQDLHRLIPSRFSEEGTVLAQLAEDSTVLDDLVLLDGATNNRILGEQRGLIGITPFELVYGIPNAHIVNAAFLHPSPTGARFNDSTRGAWYAADELETALAEVVWHKANRLAAIIVPKLPGQRPDREVSTCDDWLADFKADFYCLEPASEYAEYLQPAPVPHCYGASQHLALQLLAEQAAGIVYASVRRKGHTCVACFRPALVYHPQQGVRLEITYTASADGYTHHAHQVPIEPAAATSPATKKPR